MSDDPAALPAWRRLPVGAELAPEGGVHFRVWAPERRRVDVVLEGDAAGGRSPVPLRPAGDGYFAGLVAAAAAGTRYRLRLDDGDAFPDPASRFQPDGPFGPSCIVDPGAYRWTDDGWRGVPLRGQVLYELHVGTFTQEGTFAAALEHLPALADLGVTVLELLPVADFPGRFGWGYDGVNLFAPTRLYGEPDDFRRFIDRAHRHGLAVLLDVVYNHVGPSGNFLGQFSPYYFSDRHRTEWGDATNFDGPHCRAVREFFLANARCWVEEYHLDGLRLDATQSMFDDSSPHILADVVDVVRAAGGTRRTLVVGENEPQRIELVRPRDEGGHALDALWNDDFHHAARVALTGNTEAYFAPYRGTPQEFVSAAKYGYLYGGQLYDWQQKRRGTPTFGVPPAHLVHYLQNHDQVANTGLGTRVHQATSPGRHRALTALLLLLPQTPMLFQGQEFAASSPFLYFADHEPELARLVAKGRREFLAQFASLAVPEAQALLPQPHDPRTFERSKLDHAERERHRHVLDLHRDLLRLRREEPLFAAQRPGGVDGAVLSESAFVLRYFAEDGADRLVGVNLGRTLPLVPAPEPLLAPPPGMRWTTLWTTEQPRYGGVATPPVETPRGGWQLPGESLVVLAPEGAPAEQRRGAERRRTERRHAADD